MFSNDTIDTYSIPLMIIDTIVPLPNNELIIEFNNQHTNEAIKAAAKSDKHIAMFVHKLPNTQDENALKNINPTGVVAKVLFHVDGRVCKARLSGIVRCRILEVTQLKPYYVATITTIPVVSDDVGLELSYIKVLTKEIEANGQRLFNNNNDISKLLAAGLFPDRFTDILAYNLRFDLKEKLKYLNNPSISVRLRYLVEDVKKLKHLNEIDNKIEEEVRNSINESQKEYYLREKLKAIQNELGDKAKKESDIDELREKIIACKMPKDIEEKALSELSRYQYLSTQSGESAIIRNYLDFMVSLPWSDQSEDNKDIKIAKDQLDSDHYGLEKVKDRILEYLAVRIMTNKNPQAILCLVGPPGVGKTSLAKSIATSLNKQFVQQSLGGVKDESEIRGHRRTYLGALPGRILQGMKRAGVVNPIFLLDEVDKLSSDFRGDPASALLEVLDSEQNNHFSDHYLEEPYDLSKVFFIATANYLESIPEPLRDRMEIVQLSSYTEYEKFEIAKRHLIDKQLFIHGLGKANFVLEDSAVWKIIREYTKEAGVRDLERLIGTLIRKVIKSILLESLEKIVISEENIEKWLGKPRFVYNKIDIAPQIGVVTGLAYTQYGGDTLPVEVTYYKGNGKIVLTGKLGEVMRESAQAALSYVKANASKYQIDEEIFKENDIHVHVPEGAVPKDGPSAGVTITTAIVSALSKRYVNNKIGMTGEVTLRGRVLPIGGLREKAIAAHRSGLLKIVIPIENIKDIEDIPESVRMELEISGVSTVDEVISSALL